MIYTVTKILWLDFTYTWIYTRRKLSKFILELIFPLFEKQMCICLPSRIILYVYWQIRTNEKASLKCYQRMTMP